MVLPVIKQTILTFCQRFLKGIKSLYWFKSYGDFAEWVDFATGGASLGRVFACSLRSLLFFLFLLHTKGKVFPLLCRRAIQLILRSNWGRIQFPIHWYTLQVWRKKQSPRISWTLPHVWDSVFFSRLLKMMSSLLTPFLTFFITRVLKTLLGGLKAACIGPALSKFCPSVWDGAT